MNMKGQQKMRTQKIKTKFFSVSCGFEERKNDLEELNTFLEVFDAWVVDMYMNDRGDETHIVEFYEREA